MPINTKRIKVVRAVVRMGMANCWPPSSALYANCRRGLQNNDGPTEAAGPLHWVCLPQPYKRTTLRGCCSII
jgi:hypothetical protein